MKRESEVPAARLTFFLQAAAEFQSELITRRGRPLGDRPLAECLYRLMGVVAATQGALLTHDRLGRRLLLRARKGWTRPAPREVPLPAAEARRLAADGDPFHVRLAAAPASAMAARLSRAFGGTRLNLAFPLLAGEGLEGVVLLGPKLGGEGFSRDELTLLANLGRTLGGALQADRHRQREAEEVRTLRRQTRQLREIYLETVRALAGLLDSQGPPGSAGHSARVAALAAETGRQLGLARPVCERLYLAGLLHDIGKLVISRDVLGKEAPLDPAETELLRRHPQVAYELLSHIEFPWGDVAEIIRHHHERLDGGGYPDGLKEPEISPEAKILILAEAFDAMTSDQPWRPRLSFEKAVEEISVLLKVQFAPEVVRGFCLAVEEALAGRTRYAEFVPSLTASARPETIKEIVAVLRGAIEATARRPPARVLSIAPGRTDRA